MLYKLESFLKYKILSNGRLKFIIDDGSSFNIIFYDCYNILVKKNKIQTNKLDRVGDNHTKKSLERIFE